MNIDKQNVIVSDISVEVVRKGVKNLHLGVYPPEGKVKLTVPNSITDENVRLAIISRLVWIKKQQIEFRAQPRQTERQYISGESHYFEGRRYLLDVIERQGKHEVVLTNNARLVLYVRPNTSTENKGVVFNNWYRNYLKEKIVGLLDKWQPKVGKAVNHIQIKRMKTRWGSCNIDEKRILINLELAKKSPECLEYILVHELVHLHERHHNAYFMQHMDRCLPTWRYSRDVLKSEPLAHEEWIY